VEEPSGPGVRVDSSLWSGVEIPYHYDPMLAKVICWGPTREIAVRRMLRALREYVIVGVQSNIPFHVQLLTDKRFLAGQFHTNWLEQEFSMVSPDGHPDEQAALLIAAVLAHVKKRRPLLLESEQGNGSAWRSVGRQRMLQARQQAQRRGWR